MIVQPVADICLVVEGGYPYVSGDVSRWVHQLIESQKGKSFHIVSIVSADQDLTALYKLPRNVLEHKTIRLQDLEGSYRFRLPFKKAKFYKKFKELLGHFMANRSLSCFKALADFLKEDPRVINRFILLESEEAWAIALDFYEKSMSSSSFIDFFHMWRSLFSSLYSIIAPQIPRAKLYHGVNTGHAGALTAMTALRHRVPYFLTEHEVYTDGQQIEKVLGAPAPSERDSSPLVDGPKVDWALRDFWMRFFKTYSKICYDACDEIVTPYEGNWQDQVASGANPEKLSVVPDGVDYEALSQVKRGEAHPPTVALVGPVIPSKDVQTFIQACVFAKQAIPNLKAFIIGPTDQDQAYADMCQETVKFAGMEDSITFTGKVNIKDYLPIVDVNVLTGLTGEGSRVILEAGAMGIPSIATDVGFCREMIYGGSETNGAERLPKGGDVVKIGSAEGVARAMIHLFRDEIYLRACGENMRSRVHRRYNKQKTDQAYHDLYGRYLDQGEEQKSA